MRTLAGPAGRFAVIEGVDVHYMDEGAGSPPLILLHGFLGNLAGWNPVIPVLSNRYRTAAYDRIAFGLTERPDPDSRPDLYLPRASEDIASGMLSFLGMYKPVLIGHSAGGNLALRLALRYPGRFSALVLISPAIYNNGPPWPIGCLLGSGLFDGPGLDSVRSLPGRLDEFKKAAYYRPEKVSSESLDSYLTPLKAENWDRALWAYTKAAGNQVSVVPRLSEINIPVLIIHGREDSIVPVSDSIKAVSQMPHAVLEVIPECGHVAFEEYPEVTADAIIEFLDDLPE